MTIIVIGHDDNPGYISVYRVERELARRADAAASRAAYSEFIVRAECTECNRVYGAGLFDESSTSQDARGALLDLHGRLGLALRLEAAQSGAQTASTCIHTLGSHSSGSSGSCGPHSTNTTPWQLATLAARPALRTARASLSLAESSVGSPSGTRAFRPGLSGTRAFRPGLSGSRAFRA